MLPTRAPLGGLGDAHARGDDAVREGEAFAGKKRLRRVWLGLLFATWLPGMVIAWLAESWLAILAIAAHTGALLVVAHWSIMPLAAAAQPARHWLNAARTLAWLPIGAALLAAAIRITGMELDFDSEGEEIIGGGCFWVLFPGFAFQSSSLHWIAGGRRALMWHLAAGAAAPVVGGLFWPLGLVIALGVLAAYGLRLWHWRPKYEAGVRVYPRIG